VACDQAGECRDIETKIALDALEDASAEIGFVRVLVRVIFRSSALFFPGGRLAGLLGLILVWPAAAMFRIGPPRSTMGLAVFVIVSRNIAGLFGPFQFLVKFLNHATLDSLASLGVNRMSDVGVQLGSALVVEVEFVVAGTFATVVAKAGSQMILGIAGTTVGCQFPAGHCDEGTRVTFNDLQVAYDEALVKGNAAKRAETVLRVLHQFDSDFRNLHSCNPFAFYPVR